MKLLFPFVIVILILSGCGTLYVPTINVMKIHGQLNHKSAMNIFSKRLKIGKHINMCGSSGGFAFDNSSKPKLNGDILEMQAYKRGDFIKGDKYYKTYKKEYYNKEINLTKITRIDLYTKRTYPTRLDSCFDTNDYRGNRKSANDIALVFWIGTLERFTIRIPEKDADNFLAVTKYIFPEAKILLAKR